MKKYLSVLLVWFFSSALVSFGQNFFDSQFNPRKEYIILTNPTVTNIKTIEYLTKNKILDISSRKVRFVGVFHEGQNYDFSRTKEYIEDSDLKNYFLHKVTGKLDIENLFKETTLSNELKKIFIHSSGIFFFGGPDIPPEVYGEENTLSETNDIQRHLFETSFLFHLLGGTQNETFTPFLESNPSYLVTGFCLGMQTMNVATGGTLIQDIPTEVYNKNDPRSALEIGRINLHRNYWQEISNDSLLMGINLHTIHFTMNPFFGKIIKVPKNFEPRVYSSHHQSVERIGKGLQVTALSPDKKIIEGLAHEKYPNVFAVQFHPEVPGLYEDLFVRKFHPEDAPMTYNDIIGRASVNFHRKYWKHISLIINRLKY